MKFCLPLTIYIALQLQGLGSVLIDMWNLMDAPVDERKRFEHATSLISSLVDEVSGKGCLSMEVLEQVCLFYLVSFVLLLCRSY